MRRGEGSANLHEKIHPFLFKQDASDWIHSGHTNEAIPKSRSENTGRNTDKSVILVTLPAWLFIFHTTVIKYRIRRTFALLMRLVAFRGCLDCPYVFYVC